MARRSGIWVLFVGIASVVCWQAAQSATTTDEDAELYRLFVDAMEHVKRNYVKETDPRQLMEGAIQGMLDSLDPYSNYIPPSNWKQFNRQTIGKFGGIGIQISMDQGYLTVISPLVGTPAYDAGILAGDHILKVDGESIRGLRLSEVVDRLTGEPGTSVTITVQHEPYTAEAFEVTLTRAIINIESVLGDQHGPNDNWDFMLDKKNKIGYIRLTSFMQNTEEDLKKALDQLLKQGMRGLVLDLRTNPGGLLSSAVAVSDLFINKGTIVSTKGRTTQDRVYEAKKAGTLPDFPMAIIVHQFSASASEILAACMQDHKRAVIVGERTWGKGSVQNVIELEDGSSALKLTTASYRRPSGANIHRFKDSKEEDEWGVKPNEGFEVKFTPKEHAQYLGWRRERDRVLGKASALKEAHEAASKAAKKKAAEAKKPETKKTETKKTSGKKDAEDAKQAPSRARTLKPEEPFEDRQLEKALEYVREQLNPKPAVAKKPAPAAATVKKDSKSQSTDKKAGPKSPKRKDAGAKKVEKKLPVPAKK